MALKSILAVLRGNAEGRRALDLAATLACNYTAHLEALHISPTPPGEFPEITSAFPANYREEVHAIVLTRRTESERLALAKFEEVCRRHGFRLGEDLGGAETPTAHWHPIVGDAEPAIAERGRIFDLIVVDPHDRAAGEPADRSLQGALFGTGRPVLLANASVPSGLFRRPLVAWNRGMTSARALGAALPFLERAGQAVIVYAETQAKPGPPPEHAAAYLARHGVRTEVCRLAIGRHSVGETILRAAHDNEADLLVTGAAYHSRVRELLLGGVTGHVMRHASIPVLMAH
jgi:nucleotide-binding universal stress UspA family protein